MRLESLDGTFRSPESGARGERVFATDCFMPETAEETERVVKNDPLRKCRLSCRCRRATFTVTDKEYSGRYHDVRKFSYRPDSGRWDVNKPFIPADERFNGELDPERIMELKELALLGQLTDDLMEVLLGQVPAETIDEFQKMGLI